jgi:hypothetical protein
MTPQMLTLGRDASDNDTTLLAGNSNEMSQHVQPWWKNPFRGSTHEAASTLEDNQPVQETYTSLEDSPPAVEMEPTRHNHRVGRRDLSAFFSLDNHPQHESDAASGPVCDEKGRSENVGRQTPVRRYHRQDGSHHQSLLLPHTDSLAHSVAAVVEEKMTSPLSREELLQRDCSFFYREMMDNTSKNGINMDCRKKRQRKGWKARVLVRDTYAGVSQPAFEYSQAVTAISPPVLQHYRTKFEQLNQNLPQGHDDDHGEDDNCYDLHLSTTTGNHAWLSDTVENSSLFFMEDSSRMLMRLPRDQVRLLNDPDLEVGILSVEQWRDEPDDDEGTTWNARLHTKLLNQARAKSFNERHPPLRYVLTVEDDIYRRLVAEMSDRLTTPYCHASRFCLEEEKVDIRVAVAMLMVILLVLFCTTIEWPTE